MRLEISQVRESNVKDVRAMEDICCVKQDISDIKSKVCFTPTSNVGEQSTNEISNSNQCLLPTYANIVREKPENGIQHSNGNVEPGIAPGDVPPTRRSSQSQQRFRASVAPQHARGGGNQSQRGRGPHGGSQVRQQRYRVVNITGTRQQSDTGLTGVERIMEVFVGGCSVDSSSETIKTYCVSLGVEPKKLEELPTKCEWYKAYKISISVSNRHFG